MGTPDPVSGPLPRTSAGVHNHNVQLEHLFQGIPENLVGATLHTLHVDHVTLTALQTYTPFKTNALVAVP